MSVLLSNLSIKISVIITMIMKKLNVEKSLKATNIIA